MANQEHLYILKQGVNIWNEWRKWIGDTFDLSGANLRDADLHFVDLSGHILIPVGLKKSRKFSTDNERALLMSNLTAIDLRNANLRRADLSAVNFIGADLRGADLSYSNLSDSNLYGANLKFTQFTGTLFVNTLLYKAKNLSSSIHRGPSVIDHRTIFKSGKLPLSFLRGCGLPESLIKLYPSLLNEKPHQFYSCLISYSHKDEKFASRLYADLQNNGVRCYFAPESMKIGDEIRPALDQSIRDYDKLLILLSQYSIKSDWVEKEIETAFEKERRQKETVILPIRLDEAVMRTRRAWAADIRRTRFIGDFRDWKNRDSYKSAFDRLLRDLSARNRPFSEK